MNRAASPSFFGEGRYLHRLFGLTWPGWLDLVQRELAALTLRPIAERLAARGLADRLSELPFWEEALGWAAALQRHADRLVDAWLDAPTAARLQAAFADVHPALRADGEPRAAAARTLGSLLFEVTVGHRHVGDVAPLVQDPRWMAPAHRPDPCPTGATAWVGHRSASSPPASARAALQRRHRGHSSPRPAPRPLGRPRRRPAPGEADLPPATPAARAPTAASAATSSPPAPP
ncbi:MAG: hypothetical protein R3F60_25775 [bacterium]